MNCPHCGCNMHELGCTVSNMPLHWCPACGTIRTCDGVTSTPALVRWRDKFPEGSPAVGVYTHTTPRTEEPK